MINIVKAQEPAKQQALIDTTFTDYDALFNELDALLDSLAAPRSFGLFNIGIYRNYFNYESKSSYLLEASKKMTYTPTLSYFFKSGLGISGSSIIVNDGKNINPYQFSLSGSYDYLKNRRFLTGVALTHFFTKDSLPFYTSPLKNEVYAYFTYRKFWIRPTISASYGWGNRSDYYEREDYITSLQLALNGFTKIRTQESINDFNLTASIRHDLYWMNILSNNDYIRLTPQIVFISGTQQFGFNQTSDSYATLPRTGTNVLYNSDKVYLDNQMNFQPLSLSANLKTEYAKGKFFLQPQLLLDYYFPAIDNKFSTAFVLNAGIIF
jgi:hypothetical protein